MLFSFLYFTPYIQPVQQTTFGIRWNAYIKYISEVILDFFFFSHCAELPRTFRSCLQQCKEYEVSCQYCSQGVHTTVSFSIGDNSPGSKANLMWMRKTRSGEYIFLFVCLIIFQNNIQGKRQYKQQIHVNFMYFSSEYHIY